MRPLKNGSQMTSHQGTWLNKGLTTVCLLYVLLLVKNSMLMAQLVIQTYTVDLPNCLNRLHFYVPVTNGFNKRRYYSDKFHISINYIVDNLNICHLHRYPDGVGAIIFNFYLNIFYLSASRHCCPTSFQYCFVMQTIHCNIVLYHAKIKI